MKKKSFLEILLTIRDHLMVGVSYMLPVIVGGAVCFGVSLALGGTALFDDPMSKGIIPYILYTGGQAGMGLFIAVFGAYVAFSVADRPGIAPGLIGAYMANAVGAGFIGALLAGLAAGYLVQLLKKVQFPSSLKPIKSILFIPVVSTVVISALVLLVIAGPIAAASAALTAWLTSLSGANALIFGAVLGAMGGFDYGGPINKVAYTLACGLMADGIYTVIGAVGPAITVPGIGLWLATVLAPKKYTITERTAGKAGALMGLCSVSEGGIPFAATDPVRIMFATTLGGAVSGAIAMVSGVEIMAPMGGILILPVVTNLPMYFVSLVAGIVVTALTANLLKKDLSEEEINNDEGISLAL